MTRAQQTQYIRFAHSIQESSSQFRSPFFFFMKHLSETYRNYIRDSSHWKGLRRKAFIYYGKRCYVCGFSNRLHCHHMVYRDPLESCTVDDVVPLCEACHEHIHSRPFLLFKSRRKSESNLAVLRAYSRQQGFMVHAARPSRRKRKQKQKRGCDLPRTGTGLGFQPPRIVWDNSTEEERHAAAIARIERDCERAAKLLNARAKNRRRKRKKQRL